MSQFGIIELTRQRMRPSLKRSIYFDCPHCKGGGLVKTPESMSLDVMRRLAIAAYDPRVAWIELTVGAEVGVYVLNKKRAELTELEKESGRRIIVRQDAHLALDDMKLKLFDARDGKVYLDELGMDPNEDRDDAPRRATTARRDRSGRTGRPLPPRRGQTDRDESGEPDELDDAEDAVDRLDQDIDTPLVVAPLKLRAISRVPLGKVIGKQLTDDGGLFDEDRESSVIEVDEPHEPLGDGPQEFEEDRWNPRGNDRRPARAPNRGGDRGGDRGPDRNADRGPNRNADRNAERGPDRGFDRNRPPRPNDRIDNRRGPVRPPLREPARGPLPANRDDDAPMDEPNGEHDSEHGGEHGGEPNGNRIDAEHQDDRAGNFNGDGPDGQRRRRRRGRRGRGRGRSGQENGPNLPANQPGSGPNGEAIHGDEPGNEPFDEFDEPREREHADAAFGTSDEDHDEESDSVGSAGEEIDAAAIDSEFIDETAEATPGAFPSAFQGEGPASEDANDRPRRRRRRGGRRHRRPDGGVESPQNAAAPGTAPTGASDELDDDDAEEDDEDRIVDVTPFPAIAEDEFDDARDAMNDSLDDRDESPSLEAREIEAGIHAEPAEAAEPPLPDDAEKAAKPRGTRRGRGRAARPDAEAEAVEPAATDEAEPAKPKSRSSRAASARGSGRRPARKPPAVETATAKAADATPSPAVVAPLERSGSTDRHLVDDVPIDPEPPRRLRTYEDLDAVPDDFD